MKCVGEEVGEERGENIL